MIDKTEAIAIRIIPFSKTSHVVTWLTQNCGRLATIIKGARRPKSVFLGQYDLFYTCELLYYTRAPNGLHVARECSPLKTRNALRSDWKASACASYLCDLIWRTTLGGVAQPGLFELVSTSLDFLCGKSASPQFLFWFELKMTRILGVAPQLNRCAACQCALNPASSLPFSASRGGVLCGRCVVPPDGVVVSPDVLAMLAGWDAAVSPRAAHNTKCTRDQFLSFQTILGMFLNHHLDIGTMPLSRKIASEMATPAKR